MRDIEQALGGRASGHLRVPRRQHLAVDIGSSRPRRWRDLEENSARSSARETSAASAISPNPTRAQPRLAAKRQGTLDDGLGHVPALAGPRCSLSSAWSCTSSPPPVRRSVGRSENRASTRLRRGEGAGALGGGANRAAHERGESLRCHQDRERGFRVPPGLVTLRRSVAASSSDRASSAPAPLTVRSASVRARSAGSPASTAASARHSASRKT